MKRGTRRQLAIGLTVAVMGTLVWSGAVDASWPFLRLKHKLRECRAKLSTCDANLGTCDVDLSTCDTNLSTCEGDLGTCESNLTQTETDLETCETDLAECEVNSGGGVPKTGQTTTYATGDDGELEAGVAWPVPRFTDNGDGTVTDNLTGLKWIADWDCDALDGGSGVNWATALTNANNLADGACGLTDGSIAGDWRLPNRNELQSLLNMQVFNPAVPDTAGTGQWTAGDPFTNVQSAVYWSSTTLVNSSTGAWVVGFILGDVIANTKTIDRRVLAVSGGDL